MVVTLRLPRLGLLLALVLGAVGTAPAQSVLYITDGDHFTLQAINTTNGSILFSNTTTANLSYPIAVRSTIVLGYRENQGKTGEFDLTTGALIGTLSPDPIGSPNWSQAVDGAVNGNFNYTFSAFFNSTTTIYQTDANWGNPTALFTITGSTMVGITYDIAHNSLWISEAGRFTEYSMAGVQLSQFSVPNGYGALAYQNSTDTLWFVPNDSSAAILQYSKSGTLLQSITTPTRSSNVFGAEFQAIPEPSTYALLAFGLGLAGWVRRRRG